MGSMETPLKEIPDEYEVVEHHDNLTLHEPERGIIIMVHERDELHQKMFDRFPYKVSAAQNQKTKFDGVFDSESHAEQKARDLAHEL